MAGPHGGTMDGGRAAAARTQRMRLDLAVRDGWHIRYDGAHDQFVAHGERAFHGFQRRAFGGVDLGEQGFLQLQRCAFVGRHFADVLKILPVHAAPRDAFVQFLDPDFAHLRLHFRA